MLILAFSGLNVPAQETFNKEEFATRRAKVFEKIGDGNAVIFANEKHRYPLKFRQSPDFYYLTVIEERKAILVLIGSDKRANIFANRSEPWNAEIQILKELTL